MQTLKLNPNLEALQFKQTMGVIAGSNSLIFSGQENIAIFDRLLQIFKQPRTIETIKELDESIVPYLDHFIKAGILIEESAPLRLAFMGSGNIMTTLAQFGQKYQTDSSNASVLICIPDQKSLSQQQSALNQLLPEQLLLTGIICGTSLILLPLINDTNYNLKEYIIRLLATEQGIAFRYYANELLQGNSTDIIRPLPESTSRWIASNILTSLENNVLNTKVARIFRSNKVVRDAVSLEIAPVILPKQFDDEATVELLSSKLIGPGNIIASLSNCELGTFNKPFYMARTIMARPRPALLQETEELNNCGTGSKISQAKLSAIMESIERYALEGYLVEDFPLIPGSLVDKPILDPWCIASYGSEDSAPSNICLEEPRRWHPIYRLSDGQSFMTSLELIRYPVILREINYLPVDDSTSSGCAAHFHYDTAVTLACHELIERDAFMIAWLRDASPPVVSISSLPAQLLSEVDSFTEHGWKVRFIDLSTDLAPVIGALVSRNEGGWLHGIGASSNDDLEQACLKALSEAALHLHVKNKTRDPDIILKSLSSPEEHLELYASGAYDELIDRFFSKGEVRSFLEINRFKGKVTDRIYKEGYEIFVADINNKRIKEILPQAVVVRAIIPNLVPIQFGINWPRTGSPRIKDIPNKMGWLTHLQAPRLLRRFPHPFP